MKHLLFLLPLLWLVAGCDDDDMAAPCMDETDPMCENYDPCWYKSRSVSADFSTNTACNFSSDLCPSNRRLAADTFIARGNGVYFISNDSTAESYAWTIGNDPRVFTDRNVFLTFSGIAPGTDIPIRLITTRLKDSSCVNDKSVLVDSSFHSIHFAENTIVPGTYFGSLDSFPDIKYTINIDVTKQTTVVPDIYFYNLFNQGCSSKHLAGPLSYKYASIEFDERRMLAEECDDFKLGGIRKIVPLSGADILLDKSGNSITIDFKITFVTDDIPSKDFTHSYRFTGTRI